MGVVIPVRSGRLVPFGSGRCVIRSRGRNFTGNPDRLYTTDSYSPTDAPENYSKFSMAAWVKTIHDGTKEVCGFYNSGASGKFHMMFEANNYLRARIEQDNSLSTIIDFTTKALDDGEWHFLCASVSITLNTISCWVDGVADAENPKSQTRTIPSIDSLGIGAEDNASQTNWYEGDIDNVSFWEQYSLDDAEVLAMYNIGINSSQDYLSAIQANGLIQDPDFHYRMNETVDTTLGENAINVGTMDMTVSGTTDVEGIPAGE